MTVTIAAGASDAIERANVAHTRHMSLSSDANIDALEGLGRLFAAAPSSIEINSLGASALRIFAH